MRLRRAGHVSSAHAATAPGPQQKTAAARRRAARSGIRLARRGSTGGAKVASADDLQPKAKPQQRSDPQRNKGIGARQQRNESEASCGDAATTDRLAVNGCSAAKWRAARDLSRNQCSDRLAAATARGIAPRHAARSVDASTRCGTATVANRPAANGRPTTKCDSRPGRGPCAPSPAHCG